MGKKPYSPTCWRGAEPTMSGIMCLRFIAAENRTDEIKRWKSHKQGRKPPNHMLYRQSKKKKQLKTSKCFLVARCAEVVSTFREIEERFLTGDVFSSDPMKPLGW